MQLDFFLNEEYFPQNPESRTKGTKNTDVSKAIMAENA